ncbi:MAG TPA: hypothetical protein VFX48_04060 [Saprospiraceae bacterium]|nr:hypothetical protein [Saprospiraceae bacterium]
MKNKTLLRGLWLGLALFTILSCSDKECCVDVRFFDAAGDLTGTMTNFRNALGVDNGGVAGSQAGGRREINWDGLPDSVCTPNGYLGNFFNMNRPGQARGIEFTTPGMGVIVSADSNNPTNTPKSFGNINPTYTQIFPPFSGERIFSPIGSNIVDIRFFVPGSSERATVRAFGAVYLDVDMEENDAFEFFDKDDNSLGKYSTPVLNEGPVFLGLLFDESIVHRIRIRYGNSALGPNDGNGIDVSVMDDFIFSEPVKIP